MGVVDASTSPDEILEAFSLRVFALLADMERAEAEWAIERILEDEGADS
jgi:hypothetical protein